jgi:hypothetical protein
MEEGDAPNVDVEHEDDPNYKPPPQKSIGNQFTHRQRA